MIKVTGLNKYYSKGKDNEIHVINDTNLVFPEKGFVVLLGQSGSGKTTLINVIAGLDKATGVINYDGEDFKNYNVRKIDNYRVKNIGYVFQNYNLLPDITVYENLRLQMNLAGINDDEQIDERINYVLDALKIKKFKNRIASNLSGGQMQRVSIARALVKDSKIIIADEPTGNLDSENTIEVMNILKRISQTKLVIMVTHDRKNAEFYADRIIEIKDGVVENDYTNDQENKTLDTRNNTTIYLKDLNNKVLSLGNVKLNIYTENESELEDLELTIVKANGSLFLKANDVNYLTADSKIKLVDDHYEDIKHDDLEKFEFDPKPLTETKKKPSIKRFFRWIAYGYNSFTSAGKKTIALYAGYVMLGALMAVVALLLSLAKSVDKDKIVYSDNAYIVNFEPEQRDDYITAMKNANDSGYIYDYLSDYSPMILIYCGESLPQMYTGVSGFDLSIDFLDGEILYGTKTISNDNELVISKGIADQLIENTKDITNLSYDTLIGYDIYLRYPYDSMVTIVGIVDSNGHNIYFNHKNVVDVKPVTSNSFEYDCADNINYKIVLGSDITNADECLIADGEYASSSLHEKIEIGGKEYEIVGIYKSDNCNKCLIKDSAKIAEDINLYVNNLESNAIITTLFSSKYATLKQGRKPIAVNEILVNDYLYNNIAYKISVEALGYRIVGSYTDGLSNLCLATCDKTFINNRIEGTTYSEFYVVAGNEYAEYMQEQGFVVKNMFDYAYDVELEGQKRTFVSLIASTAAIVAIVFVFMFFLMRSKMIQRIYELGVLRELGAKKRKIYSSFISEIVVLTTLTCALGYIFVILVLNAFNNMVGDIISVFRVSGLYTIIGFVGMYVINILFGLLPVFLLLRKTPSEIVAKYDL